MPSVDFTPLLNCCIIVCLTINIGILIFGVVWLMLRRPVSDGVFLLFKVCSISPLTSISSITWLLPAQLLCGASYLLHYYYLQDLMKTLSLSCAVQAQGLIVPQIIWFWNSLDCRIKSMVLILIVDWKKRLLLRTDNWMGEHIAVTSPPSSTVFRLQKERHKKYIIQRKIWKRTKSES